MKISRMNRVNMNKLRAFFDLEITFNVEMTMTIKGFKLVEGVNGLFVSMPSQKNKEGEYNDTVFCDKDVRGAINRIALLEYNTEVEEVREVATKTSDDIPF